MGQVSVASVAQPYQENLGRYPPPPPPRPQPAPE